MVEIKRMQNFINDMNSKNHSITYSFNNDFLLDLQNILNKINKLQKENKILKRKVNEK